MILENFGVQMYGEKAKLKTKWLKTFREILDLTLNFLKFSLDTSWNEEDPPT
jgi:hypothetical protein